MARVIGRTGAIGLGLEATPGTSVAPTRWVPIMSVDFDDKVEYIDNDSGMGNIHELNDSQIKSLEANGSYEGKVYSESVGLELVALFGASPTSVQRTTTGVYDHTFAVANTNTHKNLTIGWKDLNQDLRYAYAMLDTWSLEAALDNFLKRTAGFISKKGASSSNTVSITNEDEFLPKHMTFKLATDLSGLNAASAIKIRNLKLDFSKNAEALYVLGSNEPDTIANKQFNLSGSFEAYFDSTTQRDKVFAGTKNAMRIDIVSDVVIGSSGSHTPALRFDIASCRFKEFDRGYDANEILAYTINFDALWSIADSSMVTARLTNAISGSGVYA